MTNCLQCQFEIVGANCLVCDQCSGFSHLRCCDFLNKKLYGHAKELAQLFSWKCVDCRSNNRILVDLPAAKSVTLQAELSASISNLRNMRQDMANLREQVRILSPSPTEGQDLERCVNITNSTNEKIETSCTKPLLFSDVVQN